MAHVSWTRRTKNFSNCRLPWQAVYAAHQNRSASLRAETGVTQITALSIGHPIPMVCRLPLPDGGQSHNGVKRLVLRKSDRWAKRCTRSHRDRESSSEAMRELPLSAVSTPYDINGRQYDRIGRPS